MKLRDSMIRVRQPFFYVVTVVITVSMYERKLENSICVSFIRMVVDWSKVQSAIFGIIGVSQRMNKMRHAIEKVFDFKWLMMMNVVMLVT
jgi:hypothetical protein